MLMRRSANHSVFDINDIRHQKSKTGALVTPPPKEKTDIPPKKLKIIQRNGLLLLFVERRHFFLSYLSNQFCFYLKIKNFFCKLAQNVGKTYFSTLPSQCKHTPPEDQNTGVFSKERKNVFQKGLKSFTIWKEATSCFFQVDPINHTKTCHLFQN